MSRPKPVLVPVIRITFLNGVLIFFFLVWVAVLVVSNPAFSFCMEHG